MAMHDNDELTPVERDELSALPRRRQPGRLLEERTVRELQSRGLLRSARPNRAWWATAAAAAVAFFATGYAIGQRSATVAFVESTAESQQAAMEAALQVQRTGSAWISALASLGELSADADPEALRQGREAARALLHSAALELAGLEPGDPVASRLLWLLSEPDEEEPPDDTRQAVIWF